MTKSFVRGELFTPAMCRAARQARSGEPRFSGSVREAATEFFKIYVSKNSSSFFPRIRRLAAFERNGSP